MKTLIALLAILVFSPLHSQDLHFNNQGETKYTLVKQGQSADRLFYKVHEYFKKAYLKNYPYLEIDSISKKIKVSGSMLDVLNRRKHTDRKPIVASRYNMEITFEDNKVNFIIQHLDFTESTIAQYISFENLMNGIEDPSIYEGEKKSFIDNYRGLINMFDYYINNDIIKRQFGNNLPDTLYWNSNLVFDDNGNAEVMLKFDKLNADNVYDRVSAFAAKSFVMTPVEYNSDAKIVSLESGIYDIFNENMYTPKRTIYSARFDLQMVVSENELTVKFHHKEFRQNGQIYKGITLKQILTAKDATMLEKKDNFLKSYKKLVSLLKNYIDNLEFKSF